MSGKPAVADYLISYIKHSKKSRSLQPSCNKLGFSEQSPFSMSFRATEGSREIYAFMERLWSNWCEDPSIPLCFTRDDSVYGNWEVPDKLEFVELLAPHPSPPCAKGGAPKGWCSAQRIKILCLPGASIPMLPEGLSQYKVGIRIYFRQIRNILPHNPPASFADSPLYTRGLWRVRRFEHLVKLKFEVTGRGTVTP